MDYESDNKFENEYYWNVHGNKYVYHDIVFPEEALYLQREPTAPVDLEDFVQYVRSKYRLSWKEIYFKFKALVMNAEFCKECN